MPRCPDRPGEGRKGGREEGGPRRVRETKYTGWSELSLRQAATSFTPIQPPRSLRARVFRFTSNLRPTSSRRSRPGVLYPFLASSDRRPKVSKPVVPPKSVKNARARCLPIGADRDRFGSSRSQSSSGGSRDSTPFSSGARRESKSPLLLRRLPKIEER